jgi:hypothetical protein
LTTYEPSIVGGQGATAAWYNNQYEQPSVAIYTFNECTSTYEPIEEPTYQEQYYYFSPETNTYVEYEPTLAVWSDYYEPSTVSLYTYNEFTGSYEVEESPSPFEEYYYY